MRRVSWRSGATFEVDSKLTLQKELEAEVARDGFWDAPEGAERVLRERKGIETFLSRWAALSSSLADLRAYLDLADEAGDEALNREIEQHLSEVSRTLDALELERMLSGENDARNAIVTIHAGAGGTESQDWAEMLLRMYSRFADRLFRTRSDAWQARWQALSRVVCAHPGLVLFVAGAPLLLLAAQAVRLNPRIPRGEWLPASTESAQAAAELRGMRRGGVIETLRLVLELPETTGALEQAGWEAQRRLVERVAADPRIARVQSLRAVAGAGATDLGYVSLLPSAVKRSFVDSEGAAVLIEAVPREGVDPADLAGLRASDIPGLRGSCHGVNVKLDKAGGLREALRMIHTARACGLKILLGCMVSSSVSTTAAAQLSPLVMTSRISTATCWWPTIPGRASRCATGVSCFRTAQGSGW